MSLIQACVLGLVQGLAEFLPVSSSGHLVLFKDLLGLSEVPLLYDVILHLATLVAVLIVFRRRILGILASLGRWIARKNGREDAGNLAIVGPLLLATVVTAAIGFGIQKVLPTEGVRLVSIELLVTAAVLAASAFLKPGAKGYADIGLGEGLAIGVAQGLGVFSGISRSGFTITAGLAAGMKAAVLAEGDRSLRHRSREQRLGLCRLDTAVFEQRGGEVGRHRLAVGAGSVELRALSAVTHGGGPLRRSSRRRGARGPALRALP